MSNHFSPIAGYGGFGSYWTKTFSDVYPDVETFKSEVSETGIPLKISEGNLETLYYLLYARFGNSHMANTDENQFKYSVASIIFKYGPTWEKRLEIQEALRSMSEDDLLLGGKSVYNRALNPSIAPTTDTLEELPTINEQNVNKYKKSKVEGYAALITLLQTDVTDRFLDVFKSLFIKIAAPDAPLWYVTEEENTLE